LHKSLLFRNDGARLIPPISPEGDSEDSVRPLLTPHRGISRPSRADEKGPLRSFKMAPSHAAIGGFSGPEGREEGP
jgi:hypothetical protein